MVQRVLPIWETGVEQERSQIPAGELYRIRLTQNTLALGFPAPNFCHFHFRRFSYRKRPSAPAQSQTGCAPSDAMRREDSSDSDSDSDLGAAPG